MMAEAKQGTPPSSPHTTQGEGSPLIFTLLLFLAGAVASCAASYCSSNNGTGIAVCLDTLKPIMENPGLTGLPKSKDEVDKLCKGFNLGMKCVDDFAKQCLNQNQQAFLERTVLGARLTMNYLCNDLAFQKEYLKHTTCYKSLTAEWEMCSNMMKNAIEQDRNSTEVQIQSEKLKIASLCCAKYQFRVCTEEVAKRKCTKEAAVLLRNIAESLTAPMLDGKCREVESEMNSVKIVTLASVRSRADASGAAIVTALLPFYVIVPAFLT